MAMPCNEHRVLVRGFPVVRSRMVPKFESPDSPMLSVAIDPP